MTTRKRKVNKGEKNQRLIFMKGCSNKKHLGGHMCSRNCKCSCHHLKGGSNDTIAPLSYKQMNAFKGGSCGSCSSCPNSSISTPFNLFKGGAFYKTDLPPVPAPLVGKPWLPSVSGWPGVDGVDNSRNFFENNLYKNDPQTMMKLDGGSSKKNKGSTKRNSRKRNSKKQKTIRRGGGIMPQQLTNLGRDLSFNFKSAYNSMNGYSAPVDPKPYMDQFPHSSKLVL